MCIASYHSNNQFHYDCYGLATYYSNHTLFSSYLVAIQLDAQSFGSTAVVKSIKSNLWHKCSAYCLQSLTALGFQWLDAYVATLY